MDNTGVAASTVVRYTEVLAVAVAGCLLCCAPALGQNEATSQRVVAMRPLVAVILTTYAILIAIAAVIIGLFLKRSCVSARPLILLLMFALPTMVPVLFGKYGFWTGALLSFPAFVGVLAGGLAGLAWSREDPRDPWLWPMLQWAVLMYLPFILFAILLPAMA